MRRPLRLGSIGLLAALAATLTHAALAGPGAIAVKLQVLPRAIDYRGETVTLTGTLASKRAGEVVSILAQPCRFTMPAEVATVRTKRGGVFTYKTQPLLNTVFSARWKSSTSSRVTVKVRPKIVLRRLSAGRYRAEVFTTNGVFLDGRTVLLQRAQGKRWLTIARAKLEKASSEFAFTLTSAATLGARIPAGARVRLFLPKSQATCYDAAASSPISS